MRDSIIKFGRFRLMVCLGLCLVGEAALGAWLTVAGSYGIEARPSAELVVYDDALAAGWVDWSWGGNYDLANAAPVHGGSASIRAEYTAAWGGLYLHVDPALDVSAYQQLRFWAHGGTNGGQQVSVVVDFDTGNTVDIDLMANSWQLVEIDLASLGGPATISDLVWQDTLGGAQAAFYLDEISLVGSGPAATPTPDTLALSVDASADRHSISDYIYGMNLAGMDTSSDDLLNELRLPVRRWGGNATSRYNWTIDTTNTASDWYFENVPVDFSSDQFVEQNQRTGAESVITLPMSGWVSSPRATNHPYNCGFKVSKYGSQEAVDYYDTDCGNGRYPDGTLITGNDPLDTSIAADSAFVTDWIEHLVSQHGAAGASGVRFYNLDNEPMLWPDTHRDVHPTPTSYEEMKERSLEYAAAVKAADPGAQVLGPALWGWTAYFYSALDWAPGGDWGNNPQDRNAHGGVAFTAWYLQQMQAYEQQHGGRILDYLDLHYYPQAPGVSLEEAGNASTQALRLRSTRSLWDPSYNDESWIAQTGEGPAVQLIPRMQAWVDQYYPGTKLAIGEYNWGGLEHINGALAQADVLGIFGREGLDMALLWSAPDSDQPGAFAFRMYRNYDGAGSAFGETNVRATSSDQGRLAIYAAERTIDRALTLVVINKSAQAMNSPVSLAGFSPASSAKVYRYSAADLSAIQHLPDLAVTGSGFTASFPANSITVVVILPGQAASSHWLYLPIVVGR